MLKVPPRTLPLEMKRYMPLGPSISGATEIALPLQSKGRFNEDTDLDANIARCFTANGSKGLFAEKVETTDVLAKSYDLGLSLLAGGEAACKQALQHPYYTDAKPENAKRKTGEHKPFLIAIKLGAKPPDTAANKACSDYAKALECAHHNSISAAAFSDWFANTTLSACLVAMRAKNKATKLARNPPANNSSNELKGAQNPAVPPNTPEFEIAPFGKLIQIPLLATVVAMAENKLEGIDQPSEQDVFDAIHEALLECRSPPEGGDEHAQQLNKPTASVTSEGHAGSAVNGGKADA